MSKNLKSAFTLIELLVVIAIIGIISGIIIVGMSNATTSASLAKSQAFSSSLRNSLLGNLASEWKFNETTGTSATDTWGSNTATLTTFNFDTTDGWRSGSSCVYGGCLQFDGTSDYVSFTYISGITYNGSYALAIWFKSLGTNGALINISDAAGNRNGIFINNTKTGCDYYNGSAYTLSSSADTSLTVWHYVVCNNKTGTLSLYFDGSLATGTAASGGLGAAENRIGYNSNGNYFVGYIDEVRVFTAAIPTSQIQENYVAGLNKLLANGGITKQEYDDRLAKLSQSYAEK